MATGFLDFQELKSRVSIADAVRLTGLKLKQQGDKWRGSCPKCKSSGDRALIVTVSKNVFYCFGCRKGGDTIALVAHYQGIGQKEAAHFINDRLGTVQVTAPGNSTVPGTVPPKTKGAGEGERTLQPLAYLQPGHEAVAALAISQETAEAFGAGYASKGIMRGRLAIPIHDRAGTLVAYCGRAVGDESPTLIFPNGFAPAEFIFNAHRIGEGELYLTRDPLQVLYAFENGVENVVAFLTDGIAPQQLEQLSSLMDERGCETITIF